VFFVLGLLIIPCPIVAAGINVIDDNPHTIVRNISTAAMSNARDEIFTLQAQVIRNRIPMARAERLGELELEPKPTDRDGSISGDISITPPPPPYVDYEGMILAVDRYGFVVDDDYWASYFGDYEINDLPPGEYYIFFMSDGWTSDVHEGSVINEFYDGTADWDQATLVEVTGSEEVTGIDFNLQSNSGYASILVRNSDGQPLPYLEVEFELYTSISEELPGDLELDLDGGSRVLDFYADTDQNGVAIVGAIPLGSFYLACYSEGYQKVYYPGTTDPDEAELLEIDTVGQELGGIALDMPPGGSIAGEVLLDTGDPALGATLNAYEVGDDTPTATMTLDDIFEGEYQFDGLGQGDYIIEVEPANANLGYGSEFWNNKPDAASADPITVQEGVIVEDIDFVLEQTQGNAISGTLMSDYPDAYDNTFLILILFSADDSTEVVGISLQDTLGEYSIAGLDPGDYKLALRGVPFPLDPVYYDGSTSFAQATVVTVNQGSDTENINFDLPELGVINGTISVSDGDEIEIDEVAELILAMPADLPNFIDLTTFTGFLTFIEEDGTYQLAGLKPGTYKVWVSTNLLAYEIDEQSYCAEFYGGTHNFNDAAVVQVTAGQETNNIDIELDPEAIVQGFISMPDGSPASDEDVEVKVVAYEATTGFPVGLSISDESDVYSGGDNTFCAGYRIRGLPGGSKKLAAIPYGPGMGVGYYGGGHTFDQGSTIQVTSGETYPSDVNIDLSQATGSISGHVSRTDTDEDLNDVMVASYDLTGHISGFAWSGENPSTGESWEDGRYEISGLVDGTTHYVRTWSSRALLEVVLNEIPGSIDDIQEEFDPNFDSIPLPKDEWYYELTAHLLPWETGFYVPLACYLYWGFMPAVEAPLEASQVSVGSAGIDFSLNLEALEVSEPAAVIPDWLQLDSMYPNPTSDNLMLSFTLSAPQELHIEIYDFGGKKIGTVPLGNLQAGIHHVQLIDTEILRDLPSAAYSLRLVGRNACVSQRLVILQ